MTALLLTPWAHVSGTASSTSAVPFWSKLGIRFIKWMPSPAMRLSSLLSRYPKSAQDIFSLRDWLKVVRVNAMSYAAQMIQLKAVWDRAYAELVGPAVGWSVAQEDSVTLRSASSPQPTLIGELHSFPETKWGCGFERPPTVRVAVLSPSLPVHPAPTTGKTRISAVGDDTVRLHRKLTPFGASRTAVTSCTSAFIISQANKKKAKRG